MKRIEYRNMVDKAGWGDGPWQSEPDKIQWLDDATMLPCLIVRGPVGALCGYVGVLKGHRLHGVGYGACPFGDQCQDLESDGSYCKHRPESLLEAHGGITFSDGCTDHSKSAWRQWRKRLLARKDEAAQYPKGDAARAFMYDYAKWRERMEATTICHKPEPGEPDNVWWFGFDCAHAGDFYPSAYANREIPLALAVGAPTGWGSTIEYRDVAYVTEQCQKLAQQLHRLES